MSDELAFYRELLGEIKSRIRQAQIKAALSVNAEMIGMYWDIGRMIHERQQQEGWGTTAIPGQLAGETSSVPTERSRE